jgi:hypothetical protein
MPRQVAPNAGYNSTPALIAKRLAVRKYESSADFGPGRVASLPDAFRQTQRIADTRTPSQKGK